MTDQHHDVDTRELDTRSHLIALVPLLALVAVAGWLVLARPSAHAAPPPHEALPASLR